MNKKIIKKIAAIVMVAFILFMIGLSVYFGITGNVEAFFSVISFNAFFLIATYLFIRLNRSNK
jgi:hypothetical protein